MNDDEKTRRQRATEKRLVKAQNRLTHAQMRRDVLVSRLVKTRTEVERLDRFIDQLQRERDGQQRLL